MSKPKSGKSGYTSAGIHSNVSSATLGDMRKSRTKGDRMMNKLNAYLNGKNPWLTLENPNKAETNRRFVKVKAVDHYGSLKERNN